MIISDKYRYLFIEIPCTGSWSIHYELCQYYGGRPILHKHASYLDFLKIASKKQREYVVFGTVRHPLDHVVSQYFKLKTNRGGIFSDKSSIDESKIDYIDLPKFEFVQRETTTFEQYFRKYHSRPYTNMIDLSRPYLDFVMHFESLQEDFDRALEQLGIEPVRPLPVINKTSGRKSNWQDYYTNCIIPQAKFYFVPFMSRWGYTCPQDWGEYSVSKRADIEYRLITFAKRLYLTHLRYNQAPYSRFLRRLRASLNSSKVA